MIEVTVSSEKLKRPAENLEDLHDRLSDYIGSVVRHSDGYLVNTGILLQLGFYPSEDKLKFNFQGDDGLENRAKIRNSFEVRRDGRWVPIHMPEGGAQ